MSEQNEVREKLYEWFHNKHHLMPTDHPKCESCYEVADQILSIPEIKEALGKKMMTEEEIEAVIRGVPRNIALTDDYSKRLAHALAGKIPVQEQPKKEEEYKKCEDCAKVESCCVDVHLRCGKEGKLFIPKPASEGIVIAELSPVPKYNEDYELKKFIQENRAKLNDLIRYTTALEARIRELETK